MRVLRVADYDRIEQQVQERDQEAAPARGQGRAEFERRRPPLEATAASRRSPHAQPIYSELGRELVVDDKAEGGGTDAAFAALKTKAPVVERFGLQGFGAHSTDAEYILVDSIEPRLYPRALIMDVSQGKSFRRRSDSNLVSLVLIKQVMTAKRN